MPGGGTLRVLIVEDETETAAMLASLVTRWGHTVVVAADGAQALATVPAFRPHVVLLDLSLPDQHGYAVAEGIRRASTERVLIAAVTGWGQDADVKASTAAGITHHLVKPVNEKALERLLGDYLESHGTGAGPRTRADDPPGITPAGGPPATP